MRKTVAAPAKDDILVRRTGMIPGTPLKYLKNCFTEWEASGIMYAIN